MIKICLLQLCSMQGQDGDLNERLLLGGRYLSSHIAERRQENTLVSCENINSICDGSNFMN